jgi:DNA invertase Pin-like site-specific DNA recombinase
LEAQREHVTRWLNGGNWELCAELIEVESGKRDHNRPKLAEALRLCRMHGATLVVAKLDRLARSVHFISSLMEGKVDFVACDNPHANRMHIQLLAVFAEHEARAISERTKAALAAAKARGVKLGNPRPETKKPPTIEHRAKAIAVRKQKAAERARDLAPVLAELQAEGVTSQQGLARALTARGIPSAWGKAWNAPAVARLLASQRASA